MNWTSSPSTPDPSLNQASFEEASYKKTIYIAVDPRKRSDNYSLKKMLPDTLQSPQRRLGARPKTTIGPRKCFLASQKAATDESHRD